MYTSYCSPGSHQTSVFHNAFHPRALNWRYWKLNLGLPSSSCQSCAPHHGATVLPFCMTHTKDNITIAPHPLPHLVSTCSLQHLSLSLFSSTTFISCAIRLNFSLGRQCQYMQSKVSPGTVKHPRWVLAAMFSSLVENPRRKYFPAQNTGDCLRWR